MEALGSLFSTISKSLPTIAKIGQPALSGLGLLQNILSGSRQNALQKQATSNVSDLSALAKNPALLAARARALQQPLDTGLVEGVSNNVQGQLAERGLSTSPNIATAILSQALAPYQQHNQDTALNAVLAALGLPTAAINAAEGTFGSSADTSSFWKDLLALAPVANPNIRMPGSITGDSTPPFLPSGGDGGIGSIDPFGGGGPPLPPIFTGGGDGGDSAGGFNF